MSYRFGYLAIEQPTEIWLVFLCQFSKFVFIMYFKHTFLKYSTHNLSNKYNWTYKNRLKLGKHIKCTDGRTPVMIISKVINALSMFKKY